MLPFTLLNEQYNVVLKSSPVKVTILPTGPNVGAKETIEMFSASLLVLHGVLLLIHEVLHHKQDAFTHVSAVACMLHVFDGQWEYVFIHVLPHHLHIAARHVALEVNKVHFVQGSSMDSHRYAHHLHSTLVHLDRIGLL